MGLAAAKTTNGRLWSWSQVSKAAKGTLFLSGNKKKLRSIQQAACPFYFASSCRGRLWWYENNKIEVIYSKSPNTALMNTCWCTGKPLDTIKPEAKESMLIFIMHGTLLPPWAIIVHIWESKPNLNLDHEHAGCIATYSDHRKCESTIVHQGAYSKSEPSYKLNIKLRHHKTREHCTSWPATHCLWLCYCVTLSSPTVVPLNMNLPNTEGVRKCKGVRKCMDVWKVLGRYRYVRKGVGGVGM